MQCHQCLLLSGLDWDRSHLAISESLDDRFGVGPIRLVASDEWPDQVRRQEHDGVAQPLDLARPVMRSTARFHEHDRGWLLRKKAQQLVPPQSR
jgi:hypothetical protein